MYRILMPCTLWKLYTVPCRPRSFRKNSVKSTFYIPIYYTTYIPILYIKVYYKLIEREKFALRLPHCCGESKVSKLCASCLISRKIEIRRHEFVSSVLQHLFFVQCFSNVHQVFINFGIITSLIFFLFKVLTQSFQLLSKLIGRFTFRICWGCTSPSEYWW